jgi:hypothetical protein
MIIALVQVKKSRTSPFLKDRGNHRPYLWIGYTQSHTPYPTERDFAVCIGKKEKIPSAGGDSPGQGILFAIRPVIFHQPEYPSFGPLNREGTKQAGAFVTGTVVYEYELYSGIVLDRQAWE